MSLVHENVPITNKGTAGFIVGKGGTTIRLINQRTGATCSVRKAQPENGRPHDWVWIKGSAEQVKAAKDWIATIIDEADTRAGREPSSAKSAGGYTRNVYHGATAAPKTGAVDPRMYGMMQFDPRMAFHALPGGFQGFAPGFSQGVAHQGGPPSGVQVGFQPAQGAMSIEKSDGSLVPYTMGPGEHMHFQAGPPLPAHQLKHASELHRPYTEPDGTPRKRGRKLKFPTSNGETQQDVVRQDEYLANKAGVINHEEAEEHERYSIECADEYRAAGATDVAIMDETGPPTSPLYTPSSPLYTPSTP